MSLLVISANTEAFLSFAENSAVYEWGRATQEQIADWVEKEILDDEMSYRVESIQPTSAEFFFNRFDEVWVELDEAYIQAQTTREFEALLRAREALKQQSLKESNPYAVLPPMSGFTLKWERIYENDLEEFLVNLKKANSNDRHFFLSDEAEKRIIEEERVTFMGFKFNNDSPSLRIVDVTFDDVIKEANRLSGNQQTTDND